MLIVPHLNQGWIPGTATDQRWRHLCPFLCEWRGLAFFSINVYSDCRQSTKAVTVLVHDLNTSYQVGREDSELSALRVHAYLMDQ